MKHIITLFLLLILSSCEVDNRYLTDEELAERLQEIDDQNTFRNVVFISNNDVYVLLSTLSEEVVQLTSTPSIVKKSAVISNDHSKIAYLTGDEVVVLSATTGEVLNSFASQALQIQWANDNQTLFALLPNSQIVSLGANITLPSITYDGIAVNLQRSVIAFSVSGDNDLAYIVRFFTPFSGGYRTNLYIKTSDGGSRMHTNYPGRDFNYTKLSRRDNSLTVGITDQFNANPYSTVREIKVFENSIDEFPKLTLESSERYYSPIYIFNDGEDRDILLSAHRNVNADTYHFRAYGFSPELILDYKLYDYEASWIDYVD